MDNEIPLRASPPPTVPYILRFWFIVYLLFLGKRTYTSPFILSNFPNKTEKKLLHSLGLQGQKQGTLE